MNSVLLLVLAVFFSAHGRIHSSEKQSRNLEQVPSNYSVVTCFFNIGPDFVDNVANDTDDQILFGNFSKFESALAEVEQAGCTFVELGVFRGEHDQEIIPNTTLPYLEISIYGAEDGVSLTDFNVKEFSGSSLEFWNLDIDTLVGEFASGGKFVSLTNCSVNKLDIYAVDEMNSFEFSSGTIGDSVVARFSKISLESVQFLGDGSNSFEASSSIILSNLTLSRALFPLTLNSSTILISNSVFSDNYCESVGALLIQSRDVMMMNITVKNTQFLNNRIMNSSSSFSSPAVQLPLSYSFTATFENCSFICNTAETPLGQPPVLLNNSYGTVVLYNSTTSDSCPFSCTPGTFSRSGIISCQFCTYGTVSNNTHSTECTLCPKGSFMDRKGGAQCELCANGTFADAVASDQCQKCSGGSYSLTGAEMCIPCQENFYQPLPGKSYCEPCAQGFSSSGATECSNCGPWYDDGSKCTKFSVLALTMMGLGGAVFVAVIILAIYLIVRKKPDSRGQYTTISRTDD